MVTIVLECTLATFTQRAFGLCCNMRCDNGVRKRDRARCKQGMWCVCVAGVNGTVIFYLLRPPTAISRVLLGTLVTT